ncbi:MAG TPA: sigma-70 family RNA polymerase sigma factor [Candidatus Lustribacter sp.]|nr:sigma-70 family RNA polymerase sigma factor [Candidatus Lustribacter sp.]
MPLDDEAVAQIYREHGPMLRRLVWRVTGDVGRADDIVQEVILRVWRKAPDPQNLRGYLVAAVRNLVVDQHRAAGRRPHEVAFAEPRTAEPAEPGDLDRALDQILVEEGLGRLQGDHRVIVRALYFERLTVAETAARLGIPEGTVKSRAFYAVRSLRVILDEMGVTR